jgi:hypothetical protein
MELKSNYLLEPESNLQIAAPATFCLPQTNKFYRKKIMVAEEVFVNCYPFNPSTEVKKGNFKGIS